MSGMPSRQLPQVRATRYVVPLREGGSLPAIFEADDLGTYVVKFRGAGQGPRALVAEVIAAELGRAIGLRIPDQVVVDLDPVLARGEPDPEIQDLLRASAGRNLGIDYLPRSLGFNPAVDEVDPGLAARVIWFDAFTSNVDRSWRNPNLLLWHGELWLIDHGAALYFAHRWETAAASAHRSYAQVDEHVLLGCAGSLLDADAEVAGEVDEASVRGAVSVVPDGWLAQDPAFASPEEARDAYVQVLLARLAARDRWVPALEDARAHL